MKKLEPVAEQKCVAAFLFCGRVMAGVAVVAWHA